MKKLFLVVTFVVILGFSPSKSEATYIEIDNSGGGAARLLYLR